MLPVLPYPSFSNSLLRGGAQDGVVEGCVSQRFNNTPVYQQSILKHVAGFTFTFLFKFPSSKGARNTVIGRPKGLLQRVCSKQSANTPVFDRFYLPFKIPLLRGGAQGRCSGRGVFPSALITHPLSLSNGKPNCPRLFNHHLRKILTQF
jgi:hypothetical protein